MKRLKAKPARTSGSTYKEGAPPPEATEQKGDLLICDLWKNGTVSVHKMSVVNTDANTHAVKTPEKFLQEAGRVKKQIYLKACLQQRWHFSPLFASVDGFLGVEATETLKKLASRLATKWRQPYYNTCGYVKSRIAITLVRTTQCCIQGSRVLAHRISVHRPQWEYGTGLNLFR